MKRLFIFPEASGDQGGQGIERLPGLRSPRGDADRRTQPRPEGQDAHDRIAPYGFAAAGDFDLRVETLDALDEFRSRARRQALAVDAAHLSNLRSGEFRRRRTRLLFPDFVAHLPERPLLATVMYFRPASRASSTAWSSSEFSRSVASLISIGRLMPQITSIRPPSIAEIARFEGVPPNMSVNKTTPLPSWTREAASRMSARRCSMSSSGPIAIVSNFICGPRTCSSAARKPLASRPWVTRTIPIINNPLLGAHQLGAPRTHGPNSTQ